MATLVLRCTRMAIPTILDTDIGLDADDVWALAFLLRSPELDLRLVTTNTGDTHYGARIAAKLLQSAGRDDVPVGLGLALEGTPHTHEAWLGGFALDDYPGPILRDGIGALCDTVRRSSEPVTIIGIGPLSNVAAALMRDPGITENARYVGMQGSLRRGYGSAAEPAREYNVRHHPLACRTVFTAPWSVSITPLDSCGDVYLDGAAFAALRASDDALARSVIANHDAWCQAVPEWPAVQRIDPATRSSVLFDTVAVYLAYSEAALAMETLHVSVTPEGRTLIADDGVPVRAATGWRDLTAFRELLSARLCQPGTPTHNAAATSRPGVQI